MSQSTTLQPFNLSFSTSSFSHSMLGELELGDVGNQYVILVDDANAAVFHAKTLCMLLDSLKLKFQISGTDRAMYIPSTNQTVWIFSKLEAINIAPSFFSNVDRLYCIIATFTPRMKLWIETVLTTSIKYTDCIVLNLKEGI